MLHESRMCRRIGTYSGGRGCKRLQDTPHKMEHAGMHSRHVPLPMSANEHPLLHAVTGDLGKPIPPHCGKHAFPLY